MSKKQGKTYFRKEELESSDDEDAEIDSDIEAQQNAEIKAQKPEKTFIFKEAELKDKIGELRKKFKKRILQTPKVKGKTVNFSEHMTVVSDRAVNITDMDINNDIQREVEFYNITLENVNSAINTLNQEGISIDRPDDYYVDMFKNDKVMAKVKNRLVKQQVKIQNFEEKKARIENKKFSKQLKARKELEKSKEKRQNTDAINNWKEEIKTKGEKARDLSDFIMEAGNNEGKARKGGDRAGGGGGANSFFGKGKNGGFGKGDRERGGVRGSGRGGGSRGGAKGGSRGGGSRGGGADGKPFFKKMSNKSKRISKMRGNKSNKNNNKRPGKVQRMINKNKKKSFSSKGRK